MLIKCKECQLQVSDKAVECPHCGYPLKIDTIKRRNSKRKRLPNGFGQISEIKNQKLRKPFRVMVTTGFSDNGKPICKLLKPQAFFATYNEAYTALIEYNKNPQELSESLTLKDIYEKWSEKHYPNISKSTSHGYELAWKYCKPLYNMKISQIKTKHIRLLLEDEYNEKKQIPPTIKNFVKILLGLVFDFAIEYEFVDKNCAKNLKTPSTINKQIKQNRKDHITFTQEELNILWNNIDKYEFIDMILIQCYSGLRPQELCLLETKNINLKEHFFKGGLKTESGIDRIVPIHDRIFDLIKVRYEIALENDSEYLFISPTSYMPIKYTTYNYQFRKIIATLKLNSNHRPHDPRVCFVTMAKKYNLDEYAIKYIIGHSISDITEQIYTKREPEWLKKEIQKIK